MIKHIVMGLLLAAVGAGATAQQWVKVWSDPDGNSTVHVDPKSVTRQKTIVRLTILKDYGQPQPFLTPYLSAVEQFEVNCKDATFRETRAVFHAKHMGQGDALHVADRSMSLWSQVVPDTHFASVWRYACKRKLPASKPPAK
jgi:hypothetical protein